MAIPPHQGALAAAETVARQVNAEQQPRLLENRAFRGVVVLGGLGLVIEDSPAGVQAALAAGMGCIAATSDFTAAGLRSSGLLPERWIVDERSGLKLAVKDYMKTQES